ncbi:ubiquitin carboxyl-terminal hydrolase 36-like isoform X2 [Cheilinus undulatus]|uniref:ubiquitin carboxyl-terminal hydrolase 36-like isoform X2 n=1 Tax=Cheilinus undulatus TaxID=241271 RepID=UPI001BD50211|nr:ubiquitin carboxyl-terminal hydrolase 36-like isoform X2 [Cheilinus undulatus]XP_041635741.1 ubiquitin carboxyl-terminal hydrolase 36-like isoform X2 [Cheilinus undulatus]
MNSQWNIGWPVSKLFSSGKYHGLINQGATCYLNSVLQVLFMTEDFKEAVQRCENPGSKFIDHQLQTLFQELNTKTANTKDITDKLDIKQVCEQRDAAEYYEKLLNLTSDEASQIFHGTLTHRTICSGCGEQNDTDGKFWHLPLALMDSYSEYSVANGIEEYFRASEFSGENQMYCDRCEDKRDATIECVLKHHPEVLTLLLKRFELDFYSMTYFKINRTVHVPLMLHIDNQTYELYAFVEHFGELRSGHYTAAIKPQDDGQWYNFNDTSVTLISCQPFQSDNFLRSSSAYLLFYRKRNAGAADVCTSEWSSPSTRDVYSQHQDAAMVNEEEEVGPAEAGGHTEVVITIEPDEGTAIRDTEDRVSVHSKVEQQSPEMNFKEEDGEIVRKGLSQLQDKQTDQEEIGENSRTDMRAEQDFLFQGSPLKEGIGDQAFEEQKRRQKYISLPDYDQTCEEEVRNVHERKEYPQQDNLDMEREKEQMVMDVKRHQEGKEDGNEQTEQNQDDQGLNDVRQDMDEPMRREKVTRHFSIAAYYEDERESEKRLEDDVKGKTRAEKVDSGSEKHTSGSDPALYTISNDSRDGDSAQNTAKDNQNRRWRRSHGYNRYEQERQRKDDERGKTQKRRSAKHSRTGESQKRLIDPDMRRSDGASQRGSQICVRHPKHNVVDVAGRRKKKGDGGPLRGRDGSPIRRAGSAGSRKTTETSGQERAGISEDNLEEIQFSKKPRARIYDVEIRKSSTFTRRSSKIMEMELDTNKKETKTIFSRIRNLTSNVSKRFQNMKIDESKQKQRTKRGVEELQEEGQEEHFNTKKVKTALRKDKAKRAKKHREKKESCQTTGCFSLSSKN